MIISAPTDYREAAERRLPQCRNTRRVVSPAVARRTSSAEGSSTSSYFRLAARVMVPERSGHQDGAQHNRSSCAGWRTHMSMLPTENAGVVASINDRVVIEGLGTLVSPICEEV
jgi:hypothetical protein